LRSNADISKRKKEFVMKPITVLYMATSQQVNKPLQNFQSPSMKQMGQEASPLCRCHQSNKHGRWMLQIFCQHKRPILSLIACEEFQRLFDTPHDFSFAAELLLISMLNRD
jgi:hypothetical protein